MIVKTKSGYEVQTEDGSKSLGHYPSHAEAVHRLMQVEWFKRQAAKEKK